MYFQSADEAKQLLHRGLSSDLSYINVSAELVVLETLQQLIDREPRMIDVVCRYYSDAPLVEALTALYDDDDDDVVEEEPLTTTEFDLDEMQQN